MALACPQCAVDMKEVTAPANTGYLLRLDQCPRCGGVWCDRWEVFPLTTAAAEGLDPVDPEALSRATRPADEPLRCPRCRARMASFTDPSLPPDARIERCRNCEGMWFNRGELRRLKQRGGAPTTRPPAVSDTEIDRLARTTLDPKTWPTISNLDAALHAHDVEPVTDVRSQLAGAAAWLVIRAALRLLLHV